MSLLLFQRFNQTNVAPEIHFLSNCLWEVSPFRIASDATRYSSLSLAEQRQRQEVGHQELTAQEPNHPRRRYDGAFGNFYDYCNSKTDL